MYISCLIRFSLLSTVVQCASNVFSIFDYSLIHTGNFCSIHTVKDAETAYALLLIV